MVFPLPFTPRFFGRVALFWAVLSNATAHGKRRQAIGVSLINEGRSGRPKSGSSAWRGGGLSIRRLGLVVFLGADQVEGFAAVLGLAGFAAGFSAAFGAESGLAFACLTVAGLAADFDSGLASLPEFLAWVFGSAAASGFPAATRVFFPRCRDVCFSESAATAAINAKPVLAGPV